MEGKYVFLHNPKCAGSTVHSYLPNEDWHSLDAAMSNRSYDTEQKNRASKYGYHCKPHHYTLEQHHNMKIFNKESFLYAWKFTFVRNPFDRLVSVYHYSQDTYGTKSNVAFEEFIQKVKKAVEMKEYYKWLGPTQPNHICPQYLYVYNKGNKLADYVGRMENFDVDLQNIFEQLKLAPLSSINKVNMTPKRDKYRKYYTDDTKRVVEKIYEKDLNLFNYEF
tara:strand:+ start:2917 stop:3579 length:663 start_codon:yes stop_codon:yes gene_type:complete